MLALEGTPANNAIEEIKTNMRLVTLLSTTSSHNPLFRTKHALNPWINGLLLLELISRLIRTTCSDSNYHLLATSTAIRTLLWSMLVVKLAWRLLCQHHPALWWTLDLFSPGNSCLDLCLSHFANWSERWLLPMVRLWEVLAQHCAFAMMTCNCALDLWNTMTTWLPGRQPEQQHQHDECEGSDIDDESEQDPPSHVESWTHYSRGLGLAKPKAHQDKHV